MLKCDSIMIVLGYVKMLKVVNLNEANMMNVVECG